MSGVRKETTSPSKIALYLLLNKESSMTTIGKMTESHSTVPSSTLNALDWIALVVLIIGGLNWGLVGLFNFDLVAAIFGPMQTASRVVYVIVGLAALYTIYLTVKFNSSCASMRK